MPRPRFARPQPGKEREHDDHGERFMIAISDTPPTVAVGDVSQTAIMVSGTRQTGHHFGARSPGLSFPLVAVCVSVGQAPACPHGVPYWPREAHGQGPGRPATRSFTTTNTVPQHKPARRGRERRAAPFTVRRGPVNCTPPTPQHPAILHPRQDALGARVTRRRVRGIGRRRTSAPVAAFGSRSLVWLGRRRRTRRGSPLSMRVWSLSDPGG
jgi:hypothetical protein